MKDWIPAFEGMTFRGSALTIGEFCKRLIWQSGSRNPSRLLNTTGFSREFTLEKAGAGMTTFSQRFQ